MTAQSQVLMTLITPRVKACMFEVRNEGAVLSDRLVLQGGAVHALVQVRGDQAERAECPERRVLEDSGRSTVFEHEAASEQELQEAQHRQELQAGSLLAPGRWGLTSSSGVE